VLLRARAFLRASVLLRASVFLLARVLLPTRALLQASVLLCARVLLPTRALLQARVHLLASMVTLAGVWLLPAGSAAATTSAPVALQPRPAVTRTASDSSYVAPVVGPLRVLRPFQPSPTPYSAGHRGVDLGIPLHADVLAAGDGRVTFAGMVAGRGVVVIEHPDGIRTEYEPVRAFVAAGQAVARGQPIAQVSGQHGSCPPGQCLHWGARRGDVYFDPLLLLRPLGPVRLLPWPR
jgi:murein DD-endopeptidase MepM/ murein hydrolase activator NlpD